MCGLWPASHAQYSRRTDVRIYNDPLQEYWVYWPYSSNDVLLHLHHLFLLCGGVSCGAHPYYGVLWGTDVWPLSPPPAPFLQMNVYYLACINTWTRWVQNQWITKWSRWSTLLRTPLPPARRLRLPRTCSERMGEEDALVSLYFHLYHLIDSFAGARSSRTCFHQIHYHYFIKCIL